MNRAKYWLQVKSGGIVLEGSPPEVAKEIGVQPPVINQLIHGIRKEVKGFHITKATYEGKPFYISRQKKKKPQRFVIENDREVIEGTAKEINRIKGWTIKQSQNLFYCGKPYKGYRLVV